jgi:glycosyltransferase involved in cell wall biosynthesis
MIDSSPVRLIQIEVDAQANGPIEGLEPARRHWIEVIKQGQVIGVVERTTDESGRLTLTVEDLANEFADVHPPDVHSFPDASLPKASVVVPTIYRRVELLQRTVECLLDLDYPDFEIIVVDNRVGVDLEPIAPFTTDGRVVIVCERTPGVSAARNAGVAASHGDFIAFTDDDVQVDREWLRALGIGFAQDPQVGAIGGKVRPSELSTVAQLWFEEFYGGFTKSLEPKTWSRELSTSDPLFPYSPGHFGAGCNMAIRRSTFERTHGFDLRLGAGTMAMSGEDLKMMMDIIFLNEKIAYVPSAQVRHTHRQTAREYREQIFGYGAGFTGLFICVILDDYRHLFRIARRIPRGLRLLLLPSESRSPSVDTSYPRWTQPVQLLGMAYGPVALIRSVIKIRRDRHRH